MTIDEIKLTYNLVDVIGAQLPGGLKRQGSQMVGNCPFHDDEHASLKISESKNRWKCFVTTCGAGGDIFDFFTLQGKSIEEAKNIITGGSIMPSAPRVVKPEKKWINAVPNQNFLPNPLTLQHGKYGAPPVAFWSYHDKSGNVIGFTCRFDLPDGKKDVLPYSFKQQISHDAMPLGNPVWRWSELDKPRPLYNLHELTMRPTAIVLLVEGEKTADAAKRLFPQYVVTTWIGGSDNVKYTDWSPLAGRNVFMWADNDLAGLYAMFGGWSFNDKSNEYRRVKGIAELVKANFKWIRNDRTFPKKWDVADADWTPEQATDYLKANRFEIPTVSENPPNELPVPAAVEIPKITEIPINPDVIPGIPPKPETDNEPKNKYFKCLGFEHANDQNSYVFFVFRTNVIVKLSPGGINTSNLLQLAPLKYWEEAYPKMTRAGAIKFEITTVADSLISTCSRKGIFNPNKIRGRGAWIDNGLPVIHCGDRLIVNGVYTSFSAHRSRYIYEAGQELGFELTKPLNKVEANKVIKLIDRLNWSRPIDSRLIAGWIVIAPLCGALSWRSHLWLTGASGTGKSEIMKLFVKKLLGPAAVDAQSGTTEAGIRQYLGPDALPVIFDEAESEDRRGAERMQSVLEIMRASSTSDSGKIIKGSGTGTAAQFDLKSCFAFASIGANLTQRSDISRITVVEIKKDLDANHREKWAETLRMYYETITEDYVKAFQSRAVILLPTILKNAATFATAAAIELDSQRTGDQLGALLAGAFSLTSDSVISLEDAQKWIKERDWSEELLAETTRDEVKIINKIVDSETTVETMYGKITRTIGELIIIGRGDIVSMQEMAIISEELAKNTLRRLGIKIEGFAVVISDTSEHVSKLLSNTPYAKNFNTILCRLDGAEKTAPTTFASGTKSRAVKIDTRVIFGDYENPGLTETEIDLFKPKQQP